MINISRLWYVTTAVHLWRFYFRYRNADTKAFTEVSRLNWQACDRAISKFTEKEVNLLQEYYLTSYGNYEDLLSIKGFAERNHMSQGDAWEIVKRANFEVIAERGLIDRKEGK